MIKIKKLLLQQINNSILNDNNNNNKLKEKINKMNRKIIILKKINPKFNRLKNYFNNNNNNNNNNSNDSFDINISYIGDVDNKFGIYKDTLKNYLNKKNIKKNLSLMENKFIKKLFYEEKYFENKNEIKFPKNNFFYVKNKKNNNIIIRNSIKKLNSKNLNNENNKKNKEINKFLDIKKISFINVLKKRNFNLKEKNFSYDFNNNNNNIYKKIEINNSYYK